MQFWRRCCCCEVVHLSCQVCNLPTCILHPFPSIFQAVQIRRMSLIFAIAQARPVPARLSVPYMPDSANDPFIVQSSTKILLQSPSQSWAPELWMVECWTGSFIILCLQTCHDQGTIRYRPQGKVALGRQTAIAWQWLKLHILMHISSLRPYTFRGFLGFRPWILGFGGSTQGAFVRICTDR